MGYIAAMQEPIGRSECKDAVISESAIGTEQFKILGLDVWELVDAACDVSNDTSYHINT